MAYNYSIKHYVRYYCLEGGLLVARNQEVFTSDIGAIEIPTNCLFIETFSCDAQVKRVTSQDIKNLKRYLVGNRFERTKSQFANERDLINFRHEKIYKPHILLDERLIKKGHFVPEENSGAEQ